MTVERDIFGLPTEEVETNPEFAFLADNPPEEEIVPETAPPEEPAPEPATAPAEPAPPADTPEPEAAPEPEVPAVLYAGKYQSVEELEKGYKEIRDLQRRTAERAKSYEGQSEALAERTRLLEDSLRRALPLLQQQQQRPPEGYDPGEQPGLTPQQIAPLVEQIVDARVTQMKEGLQTQQTVDQSVRDAERAVNGFYERHPEVEVRGQLDNDITETITNLNNAWEKTGTVVDISDDDALDIAYEAAKRPALRQVLELQPDFIDSDAGMELARFQASILEGQSITQTSQAVPASQVGQTVGQRKPVTESASTGATSPNADTPLDEFDQAVLAYRRASQANRGGESVFF